MKNHFAAYVHGAKKVGWFFQAIAGDLPKKTGIFFGGLLLAVYFACSQYAKDGGHQLETLSTHTGHIKTAGLELL